MRTDNEEQQLKVNTLCDWRLWEWLNNCIVYWCFTLEEDVWKQLTCCPPLPDARIGKLRTDSARSGIQSGFSRTDIDLWLKLLIGATVEIHKHLKIN